MHARAAMHDGCVAGVTCNIGTSAVIPNDEGTSMRRPLRCADEALYAAKAAGRSQVMVQVVDCADRPDAVTKPG